VIYFRIISVHLQSKNETIQFYRNLIPMIARKTIENILLTILFILPFSGVLSAQESQNETSKDEEFKVAEMILHHIGDSHNYVILESTDHPISMPLPIILWTENGLVTFMSNEFKHDEEGTVIVEKKGRKFTIFHGKIYYANDTANEHGKYVDLNKEHHPINSRVLDLSITKNVFTMFLSMIVLILLFITASKSYKKSGDNTPKGIGTNNSICTR